MDAKSLKYFGVLFYIIFLTGPHFRRLNFQSRRLYVISRGMLPALNEILSR